MSVAQTVTGEVVALERWSQALAGVHARIAHRLRWVAVRAPWAAAPRVTAPRAPARH